MKLKKYIECYCDRRFCALAGGRQRLHLTTLMVCLFTINLWSQSTKGPRPRPGQLAWQKAEFGVIFHYDLHVFDGKRYNQQENRIHPIEDYNIFAPDKLSTDQWVKTAKAAGATFALLTVTHETGFALYPSAFNPYCLKALKWKDGKADIVGDFVNSCRKYGIKPGLYVGMRWNSFLGVHDFKVQGNDAVFVKNRQQFYNHMIEGMLKELCTQYGSLFEIWLDGGGGDPADGAPDVLPIVEKYQPDCLFYWNSERSDARWGGTETGTVGYPCWSTFTYPNMMVKQYPEIAANNYKLARHGDPLGRYWMPAMADAPLRGYNGRHEWFWEPGDEAHIEPLTNLIDMYYKSVGRNATLVIGLTPDNHGLVPKADSVRMAAFGEAIKQRFMDPIYLTKIRPGLFELNLPNAITVNQIVAKEAIAHGENVSAFRLQAKVKGRWKTITGGSVVGHKMIKTFSAVRADKFRWEVLGHRPGSRPEILSVALYNVKGEVK